jgi:hypothetical protein
LDNWFYNLANANFRIPTNHYFYDGLLPFGNSMFSEPIFFEKVKTLGFTNDFELFKIQSPKSIKKTKPK